MKTRYIISVILLIEILVFALFTFGFKGTTQTKAIILESDWSVAYAGQRLSGIDISGFKALNSKVGDKIKFLTELPESDIENACIIIGCNHVVINVSLEGEEIYSYGRDRFAQKDFVGSGMHYVQLPRDYSGKVLCIEMIASEKGGIGDVETPVIVPATEAKAYVLRNSFFSAAASFAMALDGLSICGVAFMFVFKDKKFKMVLLSGLFAFFMGVWSLCEYDIIGLINDDYAFSSSLAHVSIYLAAMFVYGYCGVKVVNHSNRAERMIYYIVYACQPIIFIVSLILHMTNVAHFTTTVKLWHLEIVVMVAFIAYSYVKYRKIPEINNPVFLFGVIVMAACCFYDVAIYYLSRYTSAEVGHFRGVSCAGTFLLFICMLADFAGESAKQANMHGQLEQFEKMANNDYLTGLANRRQCEILFDEIDKEKTDYAVIFFDLNNLKDINDNYGHDAGDKLLKDFSHVLKDVFDKVGMTARIGGDEFVVIIKEASIWNLSALLESLEKKINESNKKNPMISISVASGVATNLDGQKNVRAAYRLADTRMYENKIKMKEAMKG